MSFKSIVENKRILLLGPAPHIHDEGIVSDFREYDLVVKINKMVEKINFDTEELNQKNDILYHCLDVNLSNGDVLYSIEEWMKKKVKHLRITHPPVTNYYLNNIKRFLHLNQKKNIDFSIVEAKDFAELSSACDTSPNAGTIAIYDLLKQNPKELSIRGITFIKGGYIKGYKEDIFYENYNKSKRNHNPDKQLHFFKTLYEKNKKTITLDKKLHEIVYNLK